MKIVHVITCLDQGGAETVLYRLLTASQDRVNHVVISLMGLGFYGPKLESLGIPVHSLNMPAGKISWQGISRLHHLIKTCRPDAIQTWMYHANLIGGLVARFAGICPTVWGIHNLNLEPRYNRIGTRLVGHLSARLSSLLPGAIVYVSYAAMSVHRRLGFQSAMDVVIENGVDLTQFRIDRVGRERLRSEWDILPSDTLIGFVARWDKYKDHRNLLHALSIVQSRGGDFQCVLVGSGMDSGNAYLLALVKDFNLVNKVRMAGARNDIPCVMNAIDLHVLSSIGEGFGNVTVEAMACGTPCVTTDVGGGALIVGDTGWVVPPQDARALASAIEEAMALLSQEGKYARSARCRERIEQGFGIDLMVNAYLSVWSKVRQSSSRAASSTNDISGN